jgi:hypothetical protein
MITSRDKQRGLKEANKIFRRQANEENNYIIIFLLIVFIAWLITIAIW